MDEHLLIQFMEETYSIANETSVRFVIAPERVEEVIDPVILGSDDFIETILALGHSKKVRLFDYSRQKNPQIEGQSLVIHQSDQYHSRKAIAEVRLELSESGLVMIDSNVTHRIIRGQRDSLLDICVLVKEDIETVLNICFQFTSALFDHLDQFKRHQRFLYDASLVNLGTRMLVEEPKEQGSYSLNMYGHDRPVVAFDKPRLIARTDIASPKSEIDRLIAVLSRKI